jgi:hypothetical protein
MLNTKRLAPAAALAIAALAGSPAYASCSANSIVGTWQDTYGTVAKITSANKGTAIAAGIICNIPGTVYKLAVKQTGSPPTTVHFSGHAPKGVSCPALQATLTYDPNTCTTASGPINFDKLQLPDIWILTAPQRSRVRQRNFEITQGLR